MYGLVELAGIPIAYSIAVTLSIALVSNFLKVGL